MNPHYQMNRNAPLPPRYTTGPINHQEGAERAMPVLGQHPPLPRNDQQAAVRIVQTDQHMDDGALVPTWPYYEEAGYEQPPMMYEEQSMVSRDMYEPPLK